MNKLTVCSRAPLALACTLLASLSVGAQCQLEWQPGATSPGPLGPVFGLTETQVGDLIASGSFDVAGGEVVNNIARWDGSSWHSIGGGINGTVYDVAVLPSGQLFAVGAFSNAGGVQVANAAIWDGVSWSSPGFGLNSFASDLTVLPGGSVAVIGDFDLAGGAVCDGLAVWDGAIWSARPGSSIGSIRSVAAASNGDLIAVGNSSPGQPGIERWNGTSWSTLPGIANTAILEGSKVLALPGGDLMIAGTISIGSALTDLAIYDGTQLLQLSSPVLVSSFRPALVVDSNGDVLLGKSNLIPAGPLLYRYDGVQWSAVGGAGRGRVSVVQPLTSGAIAVGRDTPASESFRDNPVSTFSGATWQPAGTANHFELTAYQTMPDGDVIVGGSFTEMGGVAANNVARWDGSSWHALAQGVSGTVHDLALAPDGSLLVVGNFFSAGGAPAQRIARWNGSSWVTIGSGVTGVTPRAVAENDAGEIVVLTGGMPNLHHFDGTSWTTPMSITGSSNDALALPTGDFLLLGAFSDLTQTPPASSGGYRLSGGSLTLEPGMADALVTKGLLDSNGDVLVAATIVGEFNLARYTNGALQQLPIGGFNGWIGDFGLLPNGDFVLCGSFTLAGGVASRGLARWDGNVVEDLRGGVSGSRVHALAIGGDGDLLLAGDFSAANGAPSVGMARARTSCPAAVMTFGAGCTGGAGPVTFASDDLPWVGGTWRASAVGFPTQSLAVHVIGENSTAVSLPFGAPGCSLLTMPILLDLLVPQNGEAQVVFAVPGAAALAGFDVFSQVVGLELDPSGALLRTTSSNALQLTIGQF